MKCTRQETNAMVCAECFRAKGESELKAPCQNPKCYFYLRTQPPNTRTLDTEVNALSFSLANGLTFSKEMRSKARAASYSAADMFMPAATLTSSEQHQVRQRSNSLWGFPPEPATSMSRSDLNLQLDRTSLYGSRVATNSTVRVLFVKFMFHSFMVDTSVHRLGYMHKIASSHYFIYLPTLIATEGAIAVHQRCQQTLPS